MPTIRAILCVDDQRFVHLFIESLLADWVREGTRVLHAQNGAEALRMMAADGEIDLVLLDINMPLLNGLAFLEQKQRTTFAGVPVVVISAEGDRPEEAAHALSLGAARVLPKEFSPAQLDACVRELLPDRFT